MVPQQSTGRMDQSGILGVSFLVPPHREVPMTGLHSYRGLRGAALLALVTTVPALAAETVPFKEGVQMPAQPPGVA